MYFENPLFLLLFEIFYFVYWSDVDESVSSRDQIGQLSLGVLTELDEIRVGQYLSRAFVHETADG